MTIPAGDQDFSGTDTAHEFWGQTAVIAATATTSSAVDYRHYASGGYVIPAGYNGTTLNFNVSIDGGATWTPLYDTTNALVAQTVAAGRAYPLPAALAGWHYFQFVSTVAITAGATIMVMLKS